MINKGYYPAIVRITTNISQTPIEKMKVSHIMCLSFFFFSTLSRLRRGPMPLNYPKFRNRPSIQGAFILISCLYYLFEIYWPSTLKPINL